MPAPTLLPIQALWDKHLSTTFPPELVGEEVDGLDVALLEAAAGECIQRFVLDGALDLRRTAMLGLAYRHLAVVVRQLDGAAHEYFLRLEVLADEVLRAVRDGAPAL